MQRTKTTSLESLTGGKDAGPISIELRSDLNKALACCTFQLDKGDDK